MAGWGACYTQPLILPKASPLDSQKSVRRFASHALRKAETHPRRPSIRWVAGYFRSEDAFKKPDFGTELPLFKNLLVGSERVVDSLAREHLDVGDIVPELAPSLHGRMEDARDAFTFFLV